MKCIVFSQFSYIVRWNYNPLSCSIWESKTIEKVIRKLRTANTQLGIGLLELRCQLMSNLSTLIDEKRMIAGVDITDVRQQITNTALFPASTNTDPIKTLSKRCLGLPCFNFATDFIFPMHVKGGMELLLFRYIRGSRLDQFYNFSHFYSDYANIIRRKSHRKQQ